MNNNKTNLRVETVRSNITGDVISYKVVGITDGKEVNIQFATRDGAEDFIKTVERNRSEKSELEQVKEMRLKGASEQKIANKLFKGSFCNARKTILEAGHSGWADFDDAIGAQSKKKLVKTEGGAVVQKSPTCKKGNTGAVVKEVRLNINTGEFVILFN